MIKILVSEKELRKLNKVKRLTQKRAKNSIKMIFDQFEKDLDQYIPVKTGELMASIKFDIDDFFVSITSDSPHAIWVEHGTRPHIIEGNPFLRFESKTGEIVYTTRVMHPGYKALKPFARFTEDILDKLPIIKKRMLE